MRIEPAAKLALATDRFERVAFDMIDQTTPVAILGRTRRLRVGVGAVDSATGPVVDRLELGGTGDAGLVSRSEHRAIGLPRWRLAALQEHYGLIPIRAQLAGQLPESHHVFFGRWGAQLLRRGGAWSVRATAGIRVGARVLAETELVPIVDGDPLGPDGAWVFAAGDASAVARRLLG